MPPVSHVIPEEDEYSDSFSDEQPSPSDSSLGDSGLDQTMGRSLGGTRGAGGADRKSNNRSLVADTRGAAGAADVSWLSSALPQSTGFGGLAPPQFAAAAAAAAAEEDGGTGSTARLPLPPFPQRPARLPPLRRDKQAGGVPAGGRGASLIIEPSITFFSYNTLVPYSSKTHICPPEAFLQCRTLLLCRENTSYAFSQEKKGKMQGNLQNLQDATWTGHW